MKKTQPVSLLLLCAMLASMSACSDAPVSEDTTSAPDTTAPVETAGDIYSVRAAEDDNLPDKDFGGEEFTIATYTALLDDYEIEEMTGDVMDDALYNRNLAVEDRFNVKLAYSYDDNYMSATSAIRANVLAGDDAHDLVAHHIVDMGAMAAEGLFMNLYDLDYIDLTRPWWSQKAVESLSYKNKVLCIAVGDYSLSSVSYTSFVAFNKAQVEDFNMTPADLYQTVRDGKWTIDRMSEIVKDVYQDLNGNTERDEEDYYGIANLYAGANTFLTACDNPIVENDKDGIPQLVFYQDKTHGIVEKIMALLFENPGSITVNWTPELHLPLELFKNGRVLFAPSDFASAYTEYRTNKDPFGALPYPKFDESQKEYLTVSGGSGAGLAIPVTVSDLERSAIITEALCAESYKKVIPTFVETALKVKLADDQDTVDMIDTILQGRVYDCGFIYHYENGYGFALQHLCTYDDRTNIASYYESRKEGYLSFLDSMKEKFEALIK